MLRALAWAAYHGMAASYPLALVAHVTGLLPLCH